MRISDWSSDVCSADLTGRAVRPSGLAAHAAGGSVMRSPEQLDTIRRLNDAARSNPGTASIANVTLGFQSLPDAARFAALAAIVGFSRFDGDNDPSGEHDFGARSEEHTSELQSLMRSS